MKDLCCRMGGWFFRPPPTAGKLRGLKKKREKEGRDESQVPGADALGKAFFRPVGP